MPWINHLTPVCWSTFWKSSLYFCFAYVFTFVIISHNMTMTWVFFIFRIFVTPVVFLFLPSTHVLSFSIDIVLTLSIKGVPWHSHVGNFTRSAHEFTIPTVVCESCYNNTKLQAMCDSMHLSQSSRDGAYKKPCFYFAPFFKHHVLLRPVRISADHIKNSRDSTV